MRDCSLGMGEWMELDFAMDCAEGLEEGSAAMVLVVQEY